MVNNNKNHLFALGPIIPHLIIIALVVAGYTYIVKNEILPDWSTFMYYSMKVFIAFELILASARSFLAPTLGIVAALGLLFIDDVYQISFITPADGWQILTISVVGLLISALMKLK